MKVLEKGTGSGWSKEYVCNGNGNQHYGCGTKLLVEESDLFITTSSSYDGSSEDYLTFECSECKKLTDIPKKDYQYWYEFPRRSVRNGQLVKYK